MATKLAHPSNALYNDEATGFDHAMQLVAAQCDYESSALPVDENDTELNNSLADYKAAANQCRAECREAVNLAVRPLFEKWAKSEDENVRMIGEAAQAEDFTGLAI